MHQTPKEIQAVVDQIQEALDEIKRLNKSDKEKTKSLGELCRLLEEYIELDKCIRIENPQAQFFDARK